MAAAATLEPGQAEMERRLYAGGAEAVCGEEGGVERQPPLGPPDAVATGAPATAYDEAPPASYLGPHGGVERWIVNKQGLKLKSHFWPAATKSARAVVLFCHGARAHGGCLPNARPPAPYLAHPPPPPPPPHPPTPSPRPTPRPPAPYRAPPPPPPTTTHTHTRPRRTPAV